MKKQILALCLPLCLISCTQTNKATQMPRPIKVTDSEIKFSSDSAYKYIAEQTAFGPRVPNTHAHSQCLSYLQNKFTTLGAKVTIQEGDGISFEGKTLPVRNIIAQYNPEKANRVILCSHWDSRPFADNDEDSKYHNTPIDGANDGASGVGVLLEIARQLQQRPTTIGIDIILFDTEDYGTPSHIKLEKYRPDTWCLGSQFWGKSELGKNCQARYGILLDMVGAQGAQFFQENYSKSTAQNVVNKVWKAAKEIGYGNYFVDETGGYITDDHYYVSTLAKVPCIDIIQYDPKTSSGFYKYWHTHNDTAENIDKNTLEAVGRTLLYVIYNE